ncbi:MAG TPA: glycosyltransferase, partial [Rhodopila sp.]|uniref:glycosyltransferase n=1 Tax=Rhodopila sp. TaxID=2480087 RepID=UPI002B66CD72
MANEPNDQGTHAPGEQETDERTLMVLLDPLFDRAWYTSRYPDIAGGGLDPLLHFIRFGLSEQRDPNRFFDGAWYLEYYPDVAALSLHPLLHYLQHGAASLRRPNARFDAAWYVAQHPEAAGNPLLYHMRIGVAAGYPTERSFDVRDYLPSTGVGPKPPPGVFADVVLPVRDDVAAVRSCLATLMADRALPMARLIVVDDGSTDPAMIAWLDGLADDGLIHLVRNRHPLGFAAAANRGMQDAEGHDVVLVNGTPALPAGWLVRLAGHAHADPAIATVCAASQRIGWEGEQRSIDLPPGQADAISRQVNAGRAGDVPAIAGGCFYIKLTALRAMGGLDAGSFPDAAPAMADFCLRAVRRGWRNRLAWDCFVAAPADMSLADETIGTRHPDLKARMAASLEHGDPCLFALHAAFLRQSGRPVILTVSHHYGGGVRRYIDDLVDRYRGEAGFVSLEGGDQVVTLHIEGHAGRPAFAAPADRFDDLLLVLRSTNVSRAHIQHLLGIDIDMRRLVHRLGVPFDVTVHDYFALCPQLVFLKWPDGYYCEEPGPGECTACLAENNPNAARDIVSWRREQQWLFTEADRVICPSADVKARLGRYGLDGKAVVVPHETQTETVWRVSKPKLSGETLRVALLGVLGDHKGARVVASVAQAAGRALSFHLIGHVEDDFPLDALPLIHQTGRYAEADLPRLLKETRPHVIWLPSTCPETYSYTLTTAVETGLPIVATDLGAFPERLAGRPNTWLVDHRARTPELLDVFQAVRDRLKARTKDKPAPRAGVPSDFYAHAYLRPPAVPPAAPGSARRTIAIVPERQPSGALTAGAYQRLLLPVDHAVGRDWNVVLADSETVRGMRADAILTHRLAFPTPADAEHLINHARQQGAAVIYDLDADPDALLDPHPVQSRRDGADTPEQAAETVRYMIAEADAVWVSTNRLKERIARLRGDAEVLETRLDERLWDANPPPAPFWPDPVRVLWMDSLRHDREYAMIEPALIRLESEYMHRVAFDVIGGTAQPTLPAGLVRPAMPRQAMRSYPGFVHWVTTRRP